MSRIATVRMRTNFEDKHRHPWHSSNPTAAQARDAEPARRTTAPRRTTSRRSRRCSGAILVNNEAFYRVSDFLEPEHFFEPMHQQIYEIARELIRAGKVATPVTLKTFLPADIDIGGINARANISRASPPKPRPSSMPRTTAAPSTTWRSAAR